MRGKVIVVQGGQYGSEGKGEIVGKIARDRFDIGCCVRTGAINAGHTVHYKGQRFAMQQVPCGWVNPDVVLYLGPGAYVHPPTLAREIIDIRERAGLDIVPRLRVDRNAGIHLESYMNEAALADRHSSIGATGKGCAEAVIAKIGRRGEEGWKGLFRDYAYGAPLSEVKFADIPMLIDRDLSQGMSVLVEGTQGTLLDLHHGAYPYTTSRMTTAAAWLAEAGISPAEHVEVILVLRACPIRVAGNSGPLPLEVNWWDLWQTWRGWGGQAPQVLEEAAEAYRLRIDLEAENMGYREGRFTDKMTTEDPRWRYEHRSVLSRAPSEALMKWSSAGHPYYQGVIAAMELTTVTKKPRRIAAFCVEDAVRAARIENPTSVVVTFANYLLPELWASKSPEKEGDAYNRLTRYLYWIGASVGAEVSGYSLGPGPEGLHPFGNRPL